MSIYLRLITPVRVVVAHNRRTDCAAGPPADRQRRWLPAWGRAFSLSLVILKLCNILPLVRANPLCPPLTSPPSRSRALTPFSTTFEQYLPVSFWCAYSRPSRESSLAQTLLIAWRYLCASMGQYVVNPERGLLVALHNLGYSFEDWYCRRHCAERAPR